MTEPTDKEKCLNIADQCTATASNDITASILVDGGSGTLRELLNDAADAIRAGWAAPQPTQAQAGTVPLTDEQIVGVMHSIPINAAPSYHIAFARAIEAGHGIKGGQHGAE